MGLLKDQLANFLETARENFTNDGYLQSVCFLETEEGIALVLCKFGTPQDKNAFMSFLYQGINEGKISSLLMIHEVWHAIVDSSKDPEAAQKIAKCNSIEDYEGREEALYAIYADELLEEHFQAKIGRNPNSVAEFTPLFKDGKKIMQGGRFAKIFQTARKAKLGNVPMASSN